MSDSESPHEPSHQGTPATPNVGLEALEEAYESLRRSFHVTLLLLLILTGSLFVFFLREVSVHRKQIKDLTQHVTEYEQQAMPLMEDFRQNLQAFAQTHPDFAPIYRKYFGATNALQARPGATRLERFTNTNTVASPPP